MEIGRRRGLSMPDPLNELADRLEADDLFAAANQHFAAHRDAQAVEVEAWDATASDGLHSS
jgi:hypothetical protein